MPTRLNWVCVLIALGATLAVRGEEISRQTIALEPGWNLIAPQVAPEDPSPSAVFDALGSNFVGAWTYVQEENRWHAYFNADGESALLNAIEPAPPVAVGRAYWVYMNAAANLALEGEPPSDAALDFFPGWNLVGFPVGGSALLEDVNLYALLEGSGAQYDVILKWENQRYRKFTTDESDEDDFTVLDPDKGYWVNVTGGSFSLQPHVLASVRGDIDVAPQGNFPSYEDFRVGSPASLRDRREGGPLGPDEQTHIAFLAGESRQTISITNDGGGILLWELAWEPQDVLDAEWLQAVPARGVTTIESDVVTLFLDRTRLVQGVYKSTLTLRSNAGERAFQVEANVPGLQGEWRGKADIETVNSRHNPVPPIDLHLDFYEDPHFPGLIRGLLDSTNSLLWPRDVALIGHVPTSDRNAFVLSGAYILPPGDTNNPPYADFPSAEDVNWLRDSAPDTVNPFPFPIQRSVRLSGELVSASDQTDFQISGAYTESIHGMLRKPIELQGTFTLRREQAEPFANRRLAVNAQSGANGLPVVVLETKPDRALSASAVEETLTVQADAILQKLSVELDIEHPAPADLRVILTAPDGSVFVLHDGLPLSSLLNIEFPDGRTPKDALDPLLGTHSKGDWKLRVENNGAEAGKLERWRLRLQGQPVYDLHGRVIDETDPQGAGLPAEVFLNGLAISRTTVADEDGRFTFTAVPAIPVNFTAVYPGYEAFDASLPGVAGRAPLFADNPDTNANEEELSKLFRPLPGIPVPPGATSGFSSDLGSEANPILLMLRRRALDGAPRLEIVPPMGPAPLDARFAVVWPEGGPPTGVTWQWDFGDSLFSSGTQGSVQHVYPSPGVYRVLATASDSTTLAAQIHVSASPGHTSDTLNVFACFFTAGGTIPNPPAAIGTNPLLMVQHVDCANFDIDRAPSTSAESRLFDADGLDAGFGTFPDGTGLFRGEDTDYYAPAAAGMAEDPCQNLRGPNDRFEPYPPPGNDPACVPRFRMTCNLLPTLLPASYSYAVAAPELPGSTAPPPPSETEADGIAKSRGLRLVTGPLAAYWAPGGSDR